MISQVKSLQRSSRECHDLWHRTCDARGAGNRDPRRHGASFLGAFLEQAAVLDPVKAALAKRAEDCVGAAVGQGAAPTGWRPALRT